MNKILKIINEEIDKVISESLGDVSVLLEQDPNAAPPAAPGAVAAAPPAPAAPGAVPAVPAAPGAPAAPGTPPPEEDKDFLALKTAIKNSKNYVGVKQSFQNAFQDTKDNKKVQDFYSKMISDKELKGKKDDINKFMEDFFPEIYGEINLTTKSNFIFYYNTEDTKKNNTVKMNYISNLNIDDFTSCNPQIFNKLNFKNNIPIKIFDKNFNEETKIISFKNYTYDTIINNINNTTKFVSPWENSNLPSLTEFFRNLRKKLIF